jgi:hypothetical protein
VSSGEDAQGRGVACERNRHFKVIYYSTQRMAQSVRGIVLSRWGCMHAVCLYTDSGATEIVSSCFVFV